MKIKYNWVGKSFDQVQQLYNLSKPEKLCQVSYLETPELTPQQSPLRGDAFVEENAALVLMRIQQGL